MYVDDSSNVNQDILDHLNTTESGVNVLTKEDEGNVVAVLDLKQTQIAP